MQKDSVLVETSRAASPAGIDARVEPRARALSPLERAVLLTVLYAEIFDYPLTRDALSRRLVLVEATSAEIEAALERLCGRYLTTVDGFVVWKGREHLVSLSARRRRAAPELWMHARRYSRWLARVPFVRMVAVSGSLAVENAESGSDVDVFCITAADRLWLARLFIVPLSRVTRHLPRRFPSYLCPNYLLSEVALEIEEQNLFTAHEAAQAVPLWGSAVFRRFLNANDWIRTFLPRGSASHTDRGRAPVHPFLTRILERLLAGRAGDAIDRLAYRFFASFCRRRAERAGGHWGTIAHAYRKDRYTVPEGGYARVVERLYRRLVRERLGEDGDPPEMDVLFPDTEPAEAGHYAWDAFFRSEYGRASSPPSHPEEAIS